LILHWLTNRFADAVEGIDETTQPHSSAELALIAKMMALLESNRAPALANDAELWAAVYANPTEHAPRQVLADFLLEREDPRGELIALQLAAEKTPAAIKREQALLKAHVTEWLGPIAPVVTKSSVVFSRGFLSEALARFKNEHDVKRYGAYDEWSTIEVLRHAPVMSLSQLRWATFVPPQMTGLREFELLAGASLPFLLEVDRPWRALERGGFWRIDETEFQRLVSEGPAMMPALHTLRFLRLEPDWLKSWPAQWVRVTVPNDSRLLPALLARFEQTGVERVSTQVPESGELSFERNAAGRLGKLTIRGQCYAAQILSTLSELKPGSVSGYVGDPEYPLNSETIARLNALR